MRSNYSIAMNLPDEVKSWINNNNEQVKTMETKSRYEIVMDMERQKSTLIRERDALPDHIAAREREIRNFKRQLEDKEEDLAKFKANVSNQEATINALIKSCEDSMANMKEIGSAPRK